MKRFFKLIFCGFVLVFLGDLIIGTSLDYLYQNVKSGNLYRTSYSINKSSADIFIFGNSRANHHYNPKIIEEETGLTSYNTGRDGQSIFFSTSVFKLILKRHKPKLVILDYGSNFQFSEKHYDRISSLLPYYRRHKELDDIITLRSRFEKLKLYSKIYPFNSLITTIIIGNISYNKIRQGFVYNGFIPVSGTAKSITGSIKTIPELPNNIDSNLVKKFEEFILIAKDKNINVVVVYSPKLFKKNKFDISLNIAMNICKENDVKFIDLSESPVFIHKNNLFIDRVHLNSDGANLFTKLLTKYHLNNILSD